MEHVRWLDTPGHPSAPAAGPDEIPDSVRRSLNEPVFVVAFTGWNDAGDAASTAVRSLIESTGATAIAEIDPEPFTDFATTRPHVRLDSDRRRQIVWPTVGIWSVSLPGSDVVLVLGPEPALQWRLFSEQLVEVATALNSPLAITLGALLADVPHTRPTPLIGTAGDDDLIERFDLEPTRYEGPTGIIGVLQWAFAEADIPSASVWAAVPGYASQIPSPRAAVALLERTCTMLGTPIPSTSLVGESHDYDDQVSRLIGDDDDLRGYIERLESALDETGDDTDEALDSLDVDPDVLVDEVEQFLREHDDEI
jgi:proteasome assembly chaperone (PAC2) family protein